MDFPSYLSAAQRKQGWHTESAIAGALDVDQGTLVNWKKRSVIEWPKMQSLARLAGVPEHEALIDWAEWKAKGRASAAAAKLKRALKIGTAAAFAFVFVGTHGEGVGIQMANASQQKSENIYIMRQLYYVLPEPYLRTLLNSSPVSTSGSLPRRNETRRYRG